MKLNRNMFSHNGTIRKYKALVKALRIVTPAKTVPVTESFCGGQTYHEKLQIVYANIRV